MIDIDLIRKNSKYVEESLLKKGYNFDSSKLLSLDKEKREISQKAEDLKAEKNRINSTIPALKKAGEDCSAVFAKIKEINEEIAVLDAKVKDLQDAINDILFVLPNMPDDDLLAGGKKTIK